MAIDRKRKNIIEKGLKFGKEGEAVQMLLTKERYFNHIPPEKLPL